MATQSISGVISAPTQSPLKVTQAPTAAPLSVAKLAPQPRISIAQPKAPAPISVQPVAQQPRLNPNIINADGTPATYTPPAADTSALTSEHKTALRDIVGKMIQNNEPDGNIKAVVSAYTQKYGGPEQKELITHKGGLGGFIQGIGQTILEAPLDLIKIGDRLRNSIDGKGFTQSAIDPESLVGKYERITTRKTSAEKFGSGVAQAAEFLLPASKIAEAQKLVDVAVEGSKLPGLLKIGAKVLGKAGAEAAGAGAVRFGQTGGDAKEAAYAALTAGALKAGTSVIGESLKALNVPEALYSKIFKTSAKDMQGELRMLGTDAFRQSNPERFNELVNSGIIKVGTDGKAIVNETLATEALNRGLSGSLKNMSNETVRQLYENESAAQTIAQNATTPLKVEKQYVSVLKGIKADYKDVGFGEISTQADELLKGISKGEVDATNGLKLRRFLDSMRVRASYTPSIKLSQSQQNFKYLADTLRGRLAQIPGMKAVMGDYRFNIEALDAITKEAARRENKDVLGLIDAALFGGGIAHGEPVTGAAIGLGRRILNSPTGLTNSAQVIKNSGTLTKLGAGVKAGVQVFGSTQRNQ